MYRPDKYDRQTCLSCCVIFAMSGGKGGFPYICLLYTSLVIAHRMRTVSGADKVVVLADGIVAEQGAPEELMRTGKIYPHMMQLQMMSGSWAVSYTHLKGACV